MCAAIAGTQVQESFEHITDTSKIGTNNRFYESWVNKIDIRELLKTSDLGGDKSVFPCSIPPLSRRSHRMP